jgi:hypothetical protein
MIRSRRHHALDEASAALAVLVEADPVLSRHPERLSWAKDRWLRGISFLRPRITGNRRAATGLRGPIVFGALLVPILATAGATTAKAGPWRWATVAVSVIVALCTAIDQVYRPASRWRLARATRSALEAEGWAFLQRTGKYGNQDDEACFASFFDAVEGLWREYEQVYLSQVAQAEDPAGAGTGEAHESQHRMP